MSDVKMAVPVLEEGSYYGEDFKSLEGKKPIRVNESDIDSLAVEDKPLSGPYSQPSAEVVNVEDGPKLLVKSPDSSAGHLVQAAHNHMAIKKPTKRIGSSKAKTKRIKKPDIRHLIEKGTYFNGQLYKLVRVSDDMETLTTRNLCKPPGLHMKPIQASTSAEEFNSYCQPLDLSFKNVQTGSSKFSTSFDQPVDMSIKERPLDQQSMIKVEMSAPSHSSNDVISDRAMPAEANESDMEDCDSVTQECVEPDELMDTGKRPRASSSCSPAFKQMNIRSSGSKTRPGVIHTQDIISLLKKAPDKAQAFIAAFQRSGHHAVSKDQLQAFIQTLQRSSHHANGPPENSPELKVVDADEPMVPRILQPIPESPAALHVSAQPAGFPAAGASTQAALLRAIAAVQASTAQVTSPVSISSMQSTLPWTPAQMKAMLTQTIPSPVVMATAPMHAREAHAITAARGLVFHDETPLPQMPNLMALEQTDQNGVLVPNKFENGQSVLKSFLKNRDK